MFSTFALLCHSRGKNCLCCYHLVLYVDILLGNHNNKIARNHLSTATSAISIGSCELEISFVNGTKFHVQPCFPLHQISWWDVSWHGRLTWYLLSLSIVCLFFHTLLRVLQCNTHMHFFIISTSYWTDSHLAVKNSYHVVSSNKWSCSLSMLQCIIPETFQSSISEWVLWHLL